MHVTAIAASNPNPHSLISDDDFRIIQRGGLYVKKNWLCAEQVGLLRQDIASLRQQRGEAAAGQKGRLLFAPSGLSNRVAGDTNAFGASDRLTCTITPDVPGGGTNRKVVDQKLNELKRELEDELFGLAPGSLELVEQYYSISPVGANLARHMDERHEETKGEKAWDVETRRSISWLVYLNDAWTGGGEFVGYCRRSTGTKCGSNDGNLQVGWQAEESDGLFAPVFLDSWIKTPTNRHSDGGPRSSSAQQENRQPNDERMWHPMLALYRISNDGNEHRVYLSDPFGPESPTWPSEMELTPKAFAAALAGQLYTKYLGSFISVESISDVVSPTHVVPTGGTLVLFDSATVPHEVLATTDGERLALAGWFHEPTQAFPDCPSSGTNELWERTENEVLEFTKYRCRSQWEFLKMGWYSLMEILGFDYAYQSLFLIVLGNYNRLHGDMDIPPEAVQYVKAEPINDTRPNLVKYKTLSIMKIPSFSIVITYGDKDIYGPSREAQQQNSM